MGMRILIIKCVILECLMIIDVLYIFFIYKVFIIYFFLFMKYFKSKKLMIKNFDIGLILECLSNIVFMIYVFFIIICFKKKV